MQIKGRAGTAAPTFGPEGVVERELRAWLLDLSMAYDNTSAVKMKSADDRSLYRSMTTIMIYKGAAIQDGEKVSDARWTPN